MQPCPRCKQLMVWNVCPDCDDADRLSLSMTKTLLVVGAIISLVVLSYWYYFDQVLTLVWQRLGGF